MKWLRTARAHPRRLALGAAAVALVLVAAMATQGYLNRDFGVSATPTPRPGADVTTVPMTEEQLAAGLRAAVNEEERLTRVSISSDTVSVQWAIAQSPTTSIRNEGMRQDFSRILGTIQGSGIQYQRVFLRGTYAFEEAPNHDVVVLEARYSKTTVDRIDFQRDDPVTVLGMAETHFLDGRFAF